MEGAMSSHRVDNSEENAQITATLRQPLEGGVHAPVADPRELAPQASQQSNCDEGPR